MIEQWEVAEWEQRAEEIGGVQEERLALLESALRVGGAEWPFAGGRGGCLVKQNHIL